MGGITIDKLMTTVIEVVYYFIALGWLLLLLVGLVLVCFRGWRRWGFVVLAVGVMWLGVHLMIDRSYGEAHRRVVERFDRIEPGMSRADVRRLLGKPTGRMSLSGPGGFIMDYWAYEAQRWISHPVPGWPYWRVKSPTDLEIEFNIHPEDRAYVVYFDDGGKVTDSRPPRDEEAGRMAAP